MKIQALSVSILIFTMSCKKQAPTPPPTNDFRDAYVGWFRVSKTTIQSYDTPFRVDTTYGDYEMRISYSITDSVIGFRRTPTRPALTFEYDAVKEKVGVEFPGKLFHESPGNEGGFVSKDSINHFYAWSTGSGTIRFYMNAKRIDK